MNKPTKYSKLKFLFYMPSFYGGLFWIISLLLYQQKLIKWDNTNPISTLIYIVVPIIYFCSILINGPLYKKMLIKQDKNNLKNYLPNAFARKKGKLLISLFHFIGFLGTFLYIVVFSSKLGGFNGFFHLLFNQSYVIRWEAEETTSIGTQLGYFGWIAIGYTVFQYGQRKLSRKWLYVAVVQFITNIVFIGRTRLVWIMATSLLMLLAAVPNLKTRKIIRWITLGVSGVLVLFLGMAQWVGKTVEIGRYESTLQPAAQNIYFYITSGFAYFNEIINSHKAVSYVPERVLYPLWNVLSKLQLVNAPPSQILDFYSAPYPTNVGTFLEPFYSDGGLLYVILGIFIYSFGLDFLGLKLLKSGNILAIFAWSNLCFVSLMGFFTPKISSTPIWLFVGLGIISIIFRSIKR